MLKTILIAMLVIFSACDRNSDVPQMPKKVKVWNGSPEEVGICRLDSDDVSEKIDHDEDELSEIIKNPKEDDYRCISATNDIFKGYGCLSWEDIGVMTKYIETLIYSCKKWK